MNARGLGIMYRGDATRLDKNCNFNVPKRPSLSLCDKFWDFAEVDGSSRGCACRFRVDAKARLGTPINTRSKHHDLCSSSTRKKVLFVHGGFVTSFGIEISRTYTAYSQDTPPLSACPYHRHRVPASRLPLVNYINTDNSPPLQSNDATKTNFLLFIPFL